MLLCKTYTYNTAIEQYALAWARPLFRAQGVISLIPKVITPSAEERSDHKRLIPTNTATS